MAKFYLVPWISTGNYKQLTAYMDLELAQRQSLLGQQNYGTELPHVYEIEIPDEVFTLPVPISPTPLPVVEQEAPNGD